MAASSRAAVMGTTGGNNDLSLFDCPFRVAGPSTEEVQGLLKSQGTLRVEEPILDTPFRKPAVWEEPVSRVEEYRVRCPLVGNRGGSRTDGFEEIGS